MSSYSICHWNTGLSPTALDTPLKDFEELTEKQRQKLAKLKARFEQKKNIYRFVLRLCIGTKKL